MASVTLSDVWVHDASNFASYVKVYAGSMSETSSQSGEVRAYANGVFRSVTVTGRSRKFTVDLPYILRVDLTVIQSWIGSPVMVRDPLGRKLFGVYFSVEASETPIGDVATVARATFELSETSLSEAV